MKKKAVIPLKDIVLCPRSANAEKGVVLTIHYSNADSEDILISSFLGGDFFRWCMIPYSDWEEVIDYLSAENIVGYELRLANGNGKYDHELIPIGKDAKCVYMAIDKAENVFFDELENMES